MQIFLSKHKSTLIGTMESSSPAVTNRDDHYQHSVQWIFLWLAPSHSVSRGKVTGHIASTLGLTEKWFQVSYIPTVFLCESFVHCGYTEFFLLSSRNLKGNERHRCAIDYLEHGVMETKAPVATKCPSPASQHCTMDDSKAQSG